MRARRQAGDVRARPARRARSRASSWPPTMLKMVDLPAPFGPMSASSSPASQREASRPCAATTPPKRLVPGPRPPAGVMPRPSRAGRGDRAADAARAAKPPTMPRGNTSTIGDDRQAQQQPPVVGERHDEILDAHGRRRRRPAARSPSACRRAAPSPGSRPTSGCEISVGIDRALGEGEQPAGQARRRAGHGEGRASDACARRCRSHRRACGESRAARSV